MLNPINHTRTPAGVDALQGRAVRRGGDVYAHPTHTGRGGWTWYTGSAGWMYRVAIESMLGLRRHGSEFSVKPCIPSCWPDYAVEWRFGATRYRIRVENPERRSTGVAAASLDGTPSIPRQHSARRRWPHARSPDHDGCELKDGAIFAVADDTRGTICG